MVTKSYRIHKWDKALNKIRSSYPHIWKRVLYWYPSKNDRIVLVMPYRERKLYDISKDAVYDISEDMNVFESFDEELLTYEFAKALKQILKDRGISQAELARRVGVSPQAVSKWVNRKGLPDVVMLVKISNALAVSVAELIDFPKTNIFDFEV